MATKSKRRRYEPTPRDPSTLPPDRTETSRWEVLAFVSAHQGWLARWHVDPNEPVDRPIAAWVNCRREVRVLGISESYRAGVIGADDGEYVLRKTTEGEFLPIVATAEGMRMVDDADEIIAPTATPPMVANFADEHPLLV